LVVEQAIYGVITKILQCKNNIGAMSWPHVMETAQALDINIGHLFICVVLGQWNIRHFYVALPQSCCNRYGFYDWGNTDMRGNQHAPNDLVDGTAIKFRRVRGGAGPRVG